jgi:hypothetical protein
MADPDTVNRGREILPRYLFLGGSLAGRRVLEIGALSAVGIEGAQLCLELGAREVTCLGNADEVRALDHLDLPPSLNLWEEDEALPPRARFDLIAVHRSAALGNPARREGWRGRLNPGGHMVVAANGAFGRGGPSYAELLGPLNELFPSVQVVLERPFSGHALVPYGAAGPPRLDARLAREAPPSHYLLICGESPLAVDGSAFMATVEQTPIPTGNAVPENPSNEEHWRSQLAKTHAAVREREQWLAELRVELEERDASLASREHDSRVAAGEAATARREAEAYREDRDHARRQLQSRMEDLTAALTRAKTAEAEREELREKLAKATTADRSEVQAEANAEAQRENAEVAAETTEPQQAAESAGSSDERSTSMVNELRAALEKESAELATERERARRAELELEDAAMRDVQLAREIRTLTGRVTASEQRAQSVQAQLDRVSADLTRSDSARQELEEELGRLVTDLRESPAPVATAPVESTTVRDDAKGTPPMNGGNDDDRERLRIALRDREERLALLRRELTDKAERISRLLEELHEAKTKGLRLFNR